MRKPPGVRRQSLSSTVSLSLKQNPPQSDRKQVTGKDKPARAKTRKELVKQKQMRSHPDIKSLTDSSGRSLSTTEQYQMQWLVETLRGKARHCRPLPKGQERRGARIRHR